MEGERGRAFGTASPPPPPQSYELKLSGGKVEVIQKGVGQEAPYSIRQMGIYLVVDTEVGLVLLWDRKTSIFLKLSPEFKVGPHPRTAQNEGRLGRLWGGGHTQTDRGGIQPPGLQGGGR